MTDESTPRGDQWDDDIDADEEIFDKVFAAIAAEQADESEEEPPAPADKRRKQAVLLSKAADLLQIIIKADGCGANGPGGGGFQPGNTCGSEGGGEGGSGGSGPDSGSAGIRSLFRGPLGGSAEEVGSIAWEAKQIFDHTIGRAIDTMEAVEKTARAIVDGVMTANEQAHRFADHALQTIDGLRKKVSSLQTTARDKIHAIRKLGKDTNQKAVDSEDFEEQLRGRLDRLAGDAESVESILNELEDLRSDLDGLA